MAWILQKAEEFCEGVTDGTHDSPKAVEYGRYLITSKHLGEYEIDFSSAKMISEEDYKKVVARSKVGQWDILFSMIGTIGNTYLEKNEAVEYACKNMGIFQMGGDQEKAYWLYYYLKSPQAYEYISSQLRGSTQQYVPLGGLREFPIPVPDIKIRRKIVEVLKIIDEKIDTNIKINRNLSEQAQAIFKEWFIDNPDSDEWDKGTFSDLVVSTLGGDWGKEEGTGNYTEQVYCVRGADIPEVKAGNKGKMPTRFILPKNYAAKKLVAGDIVVEISGGSPTQSTGRVASVSQSLLDRYDKGMVCTNFCRALKPKDGYSMFIYYYWQHLYDKRVFFSYENGTTGIKNLDINGFLESEEIVLPPKELVDKFDKFCQRIFDEIFKNGISTEKLSELRDSLLPKLMSGELDVADLDI